MKRLCHCLLAVLFLLGLSGCGYIAKPSFIQDRDKEYISARSIPPLKIPPGLSSNAFENYYPVPYRIYPVSAKKIDLVPPGLEN